ncbi:hypothetical protein [Cysteiniphilum marinum]
MGSLITVFLMCLFQISPQALVVWTLHWLMKLCRINQLKWVAS